MTVYVDLVMDNGEITRVSCPDKFEDELHETIDNARKRNDWWSPNQFAACRAEYMGLGLDRVNMSRVIGEL